MTTLATSTDTTHVLSHVTNVPKFGGWRADVILEGGAVPVGRVTVTCADLILKGTVDPAASGFDQPDRPHVVVLGGIGWDAPVTSPLAYASDAGVRLATVLTDLSRRAGEPLVLPTDRNIGPTFDAPATAPGAPVRYRDVLAALYRIGACPQWRVDPDGVTRFGARVGTEITARATPMGRAADIGKTKVGLDEPAGFLPGNILPGIGEIQRLTIRETAGKLEADVFTSTPTLRELQAEMMLSLFPVLTYGYARTYVVAIGGVNADGTLNLVAPPDAPGLPPLRNVGQWTLGGALAFPYEGALVAVSFLDANPTRPVVMGFAPGAVDRSRVGADNLLELGKDALVTRIADGTPVAQGVARLGDLVVCGPFGGPITTASLKVAAG